MDDDKKGTEDNPEEKKDEPYLGTWATKEDAAEGLKNLQGKLSDQGNETGQLRKQVEDSESLLGELQARPVRRKPRI